MPGLLVELCFEPVDLGAGGGGLVFGGTRVALDAGEEGFDLGDAGGGAFLCGRRSGSRLVELGLEVLGPVAVLGGFGAGDVEERLEVGGGDRGSVGVLLQLRVEFGGALSGLFAGGARLVAFGLEPVRAVAMALEFGRRGIEARLEIGGGGGGGVGVLLQLGFELRGALSGLVGGGVRCVKVALQPVGPVAVLGGFRGGDIGERLKVG